MSIYIKTIVYEIFYFKNNSKSFKSLLLFVLILIIKQLFQLQNKLDDDWNKYQINCEKMFQVSSTTTMKFCIMVYGFKQDQTVQF
jgi:hypothetical protein